MPNVSAQDYIDYSDYISYEDIETLDIQPIVNYNNNFNYYQFADYKYITSDKSIEYVPCRYLFCNFKSEKSYI